MTTDAKLGPKMLALPNDRWRRFVIELMTAGDNDHTAAARRAGWKDGNGVKVRAWELAHDQRILEAMQEMAQRMLNSNVLMAAAAITEMAQNPHSKDRYKAADRILAGSGLGVRQEVHHTHEMSSAQAIAEIRQFCETLGLDPRKMLGEAGIVVDAEFREVHQVSPTHHLPAPSSAGTSDGQAEGASTTPLEDDWCAS